MGTVDENIAAGEAYYRAFAARDAAGITKHLHPQVHLKNPLAEVSGRDAVVEAAKRLFPMVEKIEVRQRFGAGDRIVLIYDMTCAAPIGVVHTAAAMHFRDGLIADIDLFLDATPFRGAGPPPAR